MATIVLGGIHGAQNVGSIPPWLLSSTDADLGVPWAYYRTVVFPGVLLPLLAILIGGALCDKQKPQSHHDACLDVRCASSPVDHRAGGYIGRSAVGDGNPAKRAPDRSGFHSNEFGDVPGDRLRPGSRHLGRYREWPLAKSDWAHAGLTAVALLLTFSRGAYLAFVVTNVVVFMRGAPKKRAAFLALTAVLWFAAPAPLVDRIGYGLTSRDVNEISAGRVENLWMPLLPDIARPSVVRAGTAVHHVDGRATVPGDLSGEPRAQRVPGSPARLRADWRIPVVAWFAHVWLGAPPWFTDDPDPQFRAFFFGGHLALLVLLSVSVTNSRLTPTNDKLSSVDRGWVSCWDGSDRSPNAQGQTEPDAGGSEIPAAAWCARQECATRIPPVDGV